MVAPKTSRSLVGVWAVDGMRVAFNRNPHDAQKLIYGGAEHKLSVAALDSAV